MLRSGGANETGILDIQCLSQHFEFPRDTITPLQRLHITRPRRRPNLPQLALKSTRQVFLPFGRARRCPLIGPI